MPMKPAIPQRLTGARVVLRSPTLRDARTIFETVDRNRRHLRPWMWWVDGTKGPKQIADFIRSCQAGRRARSWFEFGIFLDGRYVGEIGMFNLDHDHRRGEIGYWLDEDTTGQGLMTEATAVLVAAAYKHLKLDRIQVCCQPANEPSKAIPLRLGFTYEGTLRHIVRMYRRACDWDFYSMLRQEFRTAKTRKRFARHLKPRARGRGHSR